MMLICLLWCLLYLQHMFRLLFVYHISLHVIIMWRWVLSSYYQLVFAWHFVDEAFNNFFYVYVDGLHSKCTVILLSIWFWLQARIDCYWCIWSALYSHRNCYHCCTDCIGDSIQVHMHVCMHPCTHMYT